MLEAGGYWGVAALMAIENVVLPLPSELIMPLAGYATSQGRMSIWWVIVAGAAGSAIGALPLYYPSLLLGEDKVKRWLDGHARWILRKGDVEKAQKRVARNGARAVFLAQLLPGLRGVISIPAGFAKMNVLAFLWWNFAGTLFWCAVLAWLGKLLGSQFMKIDKVLGPVGWSVLLALILGGAIWLRARKTG
jgi:membrane protein DedA with SNARE-associated domain